MDLARGVRRRRLGGTLVRDRSVGACAPAVGVGERSDSLGLQPVDLVGPRREREHQGLRIEHGVGREHLRFLRLSRDPDADHSHDDLVVVAAQVGRPDEVAEPGALAVKTIAPTT